MPSPNPVVIWGTDGSIAYLFNKLGMLSYPAGSDEERIMEMALEAGAEDVVNNEDGSIDVVTAVDDYHAVLTAMEQAGLSPERAELTMQAATEIDLQLDDAEKVMRLVDMLEDLDDVQQVYTNADFSDEVMAKLG